MKISDLPPYPTDSPYILPPSPIAQLKEQLKILQSELSQDPFYSKTDEIKTNLEKASAELNQSKVTILIYQLIDKINAYQLSCHRKDDPRIREGLFNQILTTCAQMDELLNTL